MAQNLARHGVGCRAIPRRAHPGNDYRVSPGKSIAGYGGQECWPLVTRPCSPQQRPFPELPPNILVQGDNLAVNRNKFWTTWQQAIVTLRAGVSCACAVA